jgi:hypothetical protein
MACQQTNAWTSLSKRNKKVYVIRTTSIGMLMREIKMIASAVLEKTLSTHKLQVTIHIRFLPKLNQFTRVVFHLFHLNRKLRWDSARTCVRMMTTVKPLSMTLIIQEMVKTVKLLPSTVTLVMVMSKLFASPKTMANQQLFQKLKMKQQLLMKLPQKIP